MRNQQAPKIRRAGAYIVKAAESRPSRVAAKSDGRISTPSSADKRLARALNIKRAVVTRCARRRRPLVLGS